MCKVAIMLLLILLPAGPTPAHDGEHPLMFEARPCAEMCAHKSVGTALGYEACERPFPDGSYADTVTDPAPMPPEGKKIVLRAAISPVVDWDLFICELRSDGSHNGRALQVGANVLGENCDNSLGAKNPVPVGCKEIVVTPADAGTQYVLRAYNYADPFPATGAYMWVSV
jgi:hypothetical protein